MRVTRGRKGTPAQGGNKKNMLTEEALQQKKKKKGKKVHMTNSTRTTST
jgi:hypothetical protein